VRMVEAENSRNIVCDALNKIQSDLVFDTLLMYARKNYPAFWRDVTSVDTFMHVKERLDFAYKCQIK